MLKNTGTNFITRIWYGIPEQIRHLMVPCVVILAGLVIAHHLFVPRDFGLWGHYRASSVLQNAEKPMNYAGSQACADCHGDIVATKMTGYHKGVACEIVSRPCRPPHRGPGEGEAHHPQGSEPLSPLPRVPAVEADRFSPGCFRIAQPGEALHHLPPAPRSETAPRPERVRGVSYKHPAHHRPLPSREPRVYRLP